MVTHMIFSNFRIARLTTGLMLWLSLFVYPSAWAYKVEKICEDIPATSSSPAQKKCKVVRVVEGGSAKAGADAKGDGKAEGHGDAKKDAKPAGGH